MISIRDLIREFDDSSPTPRVPCGFGEVDRATSGGVGRGQFWLVTGTPGQGRTTLLIQMAALLAVDYGWQTHLICPREPARYVAARLLANQSRVPMADVATGQSDDPERAQRVRQLLEEAPLHIAAQGEPHGLDVVGELERALPDALLLDDADTVPGAFPDRLRTLADAGVFVAGTMPRHLIVDHDSQGPHLRPEWAAVADVVLEVRQATWPADTHGIRPGEADLILLKNRWGPTITASVILAAHYAEFSDFEHGNTGEQS